MSFEIPMQFSVKYAEIKTLCFQHFVTLLVYNYIFWYIHNRASLFANVINFFNGGYLNLIQPK